MPWVTPLVSFACCRRVYSIGEWTHLDVAWRAYVFPGILIGFRMHACVRPLIFGSGFWNPNFRKPKIYVNSIKDLRCSRLLEIFRRIGVHIRKKKLCRNWSKFLCRPEFFFPFFTDDRPMTPTRLSRLDEKNALIGLNNRLAAIIDRNQQLESENSKLNKEVRSTFSFHSVAWASPLC